MVKFVMVAKVATAIMTIILAISTYDDHLLLNFQEQLGQDQQLVKDLWSIKSHNQQIHWELTVYAVFTSFMVSDIDI